MPLGIADLLLVYESVDSKHGSCAGQPCELWQTDYADKVHRSLILLSTDSCLKHDDSRGVH